jgi:hypothetical protein
MTGWTPSYIDGAAHTRYTPVCWSPAYLPAEVRPSAVQI